MMALLSNLHLLALLAILSFTSGCFITNCPPGGKRSVPEVEKTQIRECASCGPEGQGGRCYGPESCCSPEFGCMIGTPETYVCLLENRVNAVCHNPGAPCNGPGNLKGTCAADGICCSSDSCEFDEFCVMDPPRRPPLRPVTFDRIAEQKSGLAELGGYNLPVPRPEPPLEIINRFKLDIQRQRFDKRKGSSR